MTRSPSLGEGNGFDNASGTATKNTSAPHSAPATRMAEWEIRSAAVAARGARISTPALLSDDVCPPPRHCRERPVARAPRPRWSSSRDYFEVNSLPRLDRVIVPRPHGLSLTPAACSNRSAAMALEPLRSGAAHIVLLRSIAAAHPDTFDGSENGQEIHPRTPTLYPMTHLVTVTFDQQKEPVGR